MFNPAEIQKKMTRDEGQQAPQTEAVGEELKATQEKEVLEAERVYQQGVTNLKDLIAPSAMRVDSTFLELNGKFVSTLFVTTSTSIKPMWP